MEANAFSLGDLVLAKLEEYPYWPAIVQKCTREDEHYRGKWRQAGADDEPMKLCCFFLIHRSENWVPLDRVKQFIAAEVHTNHCNRESPHYSAQKAAIEEAEEIYNERIANSYISEQLSSPLDDTEDDCCVLASSIDSGQPNKRSCSPEFGARGEKKMKIMKRSTQSSPKVHGNCAEIRKCPSERENVQHAGDTLASLRTAIRRKQKELQAVLSEKRHLEQSIKERDVFLDEFENTSAFAEVPDFPLHIDLQLPDLSTYKSKTIAKAEFEELIDDLKVNFFNFKYKLKKCTLLRATLGGTIEERKHGLEENFEQIRECEHLAIQQHATVAKALSCLLEAFIDLEDLRLRQAGKMITRILKSCNESSSIRYLCAKIVDKWKAQCRQFDEEHVKVAK